MVLLRLGLTKPKACFYFSAVLAWCEAISCKKSIQLWQ